MSRFACVGDLRNFFEGFGGTDYAYLEHHFRRFRATVAELQAGWSPDLGCRVLDVGAHWLHQSALLWGERYRVTAVDLPSTFETEWVRNAAARMEIDLVPVNDLSRPVEFDRFDENSFDIVMFSEIVEHVTFNPVEFWRAIYRILRPGGKVVITTPNYYSPYSRVWFPERFFSGFGGGISVHEILTQNTYSHHWKEFTVRELIYYFARLSPDFSTIKSRHFPSFDENPPEINRWARWAYRLKRRNPVDHANIYMEVEIRAKRHGIVITPSW